MRGQIQQMFVFLSAVLVIGATLFLGSKLIGGLTERSCKADDVQFTSAVGAVLDENSVFGSRNVVKIRKPCDAIAVCFVDTGAIGNAAFASNDSAIRSAVRNGVKSNIFLKSRDSTVAAGFDERIVLEPAGQPVLHDMCAQAIGGSFSIMTSGYGNKVGIRT